MWTFLVGFALEGDYQRRGEGDSFSGAVLSCRLLFFSSGFGATGPEKSMREIIHPRSGAIVIPSLVFGYSPIIFNALKGAIRAPRRRWWIYSAIIAHSFKINQGQTAGGSGAGVDGSVSGS